MAATIDFVLEKSEVALALAADGGDKPTLEDLLAAFCAARRRSRKCFKRATEVLDYLPKFQDDTFKLSNCVLDGKLPFKSLDGLKEADLTLLAELADYLCFPIDWVTKLRAVAAHGKRHYEYVIWSTEKYGDVKFSKMDLHHWAFIGDLRGLQWAHEEGYSHGFEHVCYCAAKEGHFDCLIYGYRMCSTVVRGVYDHTCWKKAKCLAAAKTPEIREWIEAQSDVEHCVVCMHGKKHARDFALGLV